MPGVPLSDAAYRYVSGLDSYDSYIGALSQFCVVNVGATAQWLARFAGDDTLRRQFGAAARRSVESKFDWPMVMPRYRALWDEQHARLTKARADNAPSSQAWRLYDPSVVFAGYPSNRVPPEHGLARGPLFTSAWSEAV